MNAESEPAATGSSAGLYHAALEHFRAGRHADAEFCCRGALARDSKHADALHLRALGRDEKALLRFDRARSSVGRVELNL